MVHPVGFRGVHTARGAWDAKVNLEHAICEFYLVTSAQKNCNMRMLQKQYFYKFIQMQL